MNNESTHNEIPEADDNSRYAAVRFPDFAGDQPAATDNKKISLSALSDVTAEVRGEIGRTSILLSDLLRLRAGCVVKLDKPVGAKSDLVINSKIIAHGDIAADQRGVSIKITELV
ncbi:MAG: FliM/FliN family flagellar motor switch protein [Oscillospiraceae bacterium]|nr:FliM/FliN family flagellar motor switch protein [Oscillospiraceae bacterium]